MNCGSDRIVNSQLRALIPVAVACALAVSACSSSTKEPLPPGVLPPAEEDAVFGLSWQYTEDELRSAGVIAGESEPFRGKAGRLYSTVRLPRRFEDADYYALAFNNAGELLRIACVGKSFKADPEGNAVRKRYEELKEIVSRKIPIVGTYEDQEEAWARPSDWWASLQDGKVHWATGFRGEVMEAVLEIRAETAAAGSYGLIVDHLPRMQALNRVVETDNKSAF